MIAIALITTSATIVFALGTLHLVYTFYGPKLLPRDAALQSGMREVSMVITRETTVWKAWIGFNASHSFGAIFYGLVYGYLALMHPEFLFRSDFLLVVGFCLLAGYLLLAKLYWFSVPFRGVLIAIVCYAGGVIAGR